MTKDLSEDDGVILCVSTWGRVGEPQMKELSILGSLEHSSFKLPPLYVMLGLEPRALCIPGKHSTTKLPPHSNSYFYWNTI